MVYDHEADFMKHVEKVQAWLAEIVQRLEERGLEHDRSKLSGLEREYYTQYGPRLGSVEFGSAEYHEVCTQMARGMTLHYEANRHHPEHFGDLGIAGMTLVDLVEMFCDWMAASERNSGKLNFTYLQERFKLSKQLSSILANTEAMLRPS